MSAGDAAVARMVSAPERGVEVPSMDPIFTAWLALVGGIVAVLLLDLFVLH